MNSLQPLTRLYDNLTYFDQYGGSVLLFICMTLMLILMVSFFHSMLYAQQIRDEWPTQRCKPHILPFAGFINCPDHMTVAEYTLQNFNYCTQTILSNTAGQAVQPITFLTQLLQSMMTSAQASVQSTRAAIDRIRTSMQSITEELMGRILNTSIPLMQIVISVKDFLAKLQGVMTGSLFTLLGSYYALKSLMGAVAQMIVGILIALSVMIAAFWAVPFTWCAAAANTAIFTAIAIPLALILVFMQDTLKINTHYKIPRIKCFDRKTPILLQSGDKKAIEHIVPGDVLWNHNVVTATIKVVTEGSTMYYLGNTLVSDSHVVQYRDQWIRVADHPAAIQYSNPYVEPVLYCLNTTQKRIVIDSHVFTDWDELYGPHLQHILRYLRTSKTSNIHPSAETGFAGHTAVSLSNGTIKFLSNLQPNDVLKSGEKVYGVVKIDGSTLGSQYSYQLDSHTSVEGRDPHLHQYPSKLLSLQHRHPILYHVLTDRGVLALTHLQVTVPDYNGAIDQILRTTL